MTGIPSYRYLSPQAWDHKIQRALELASPCRLCPRSCKVRRLEGERGFCRSGAGAVTASLTLHHGEEPPISGENGSGTVFFTGCNLRCLFCQNFPISRLEVGRALSVGQLAQGFLHLARKGAHNINFVTPTPHIPWILMALREASRLGLNLPIVYNTNGYDALTTLEVLENVVDVYLPDMKYDDDAHALRCSGVSGYRAANRVAVLEMYRQVGPLETNEAGLAVRGLIVRHLVLPEGIAGTREVFRFVAKAGLLEASFSLMSQYFPADRDKCTGALGRGLLKREFQEAVDAMLRAGVTRGYWQDEILG